VTAADSLASTNSRLKTHWFNQTFKPIHAAKPDIHVPSSSQVTNKQTTKHLGIGQSDLYTPKPKLN